MKLDGQYLLSAALQSVGQARSLSLHDTPEDKAPKGYAAGLLWTDFMLPSRTASRAGKRLSASPGQLRMCARQDPLPAHQQGLLR